MRHLRLCFGGVGLGAAVILLLLGQATADSSTTRVGPSACDRSSRPRPDDLLSKALSEIDCQRLDEIWYAPPWRTDLELDANALYAQMQARLKELHQFDAQKHTMLTGAKLAAIARAVAALEAKGSLPAQAGAARDKRIAALRTALDIVVCEGGGGIRGIAFRVRRLATGWPTSAEVVNLWALEVDATVQLANRAAEEKGGALAAHFGLEEDEIPRLVRKAAREFERRSLELLRRTAKEGECRLAANIHLVKHLWCGKKEERDEAMRLVKDCHQQWKADPALWSMAEGQIPEVLRSFTGALEGLSFTTVDGTRWDSARLKRRITILIVWHPARDRSVYGVLRGYIRKCGDSAWVLARVSGGEPLPVPPDLEAHTIKASSVTLERMLGVLGRVVLPTFSVITKDLSIVGTGLGRNEFWDYVDEIMAEDRPKVPGQQPETRGAPETD